MVVGNALDPLDVGGLVTGVVCGGRNAVVIDDGLAGVVDGGGSDAPIAEVAVGPTAEATAVVDWFVTAAGVAAAAMVVRSEI